MIGLRTRRALLLVTPLLLGGGAASAQQEPAGGEMLWTTYAKALEEAPEKKSGILFYFVPKGQVMDHQVFLKKPMPLLSEDHPCVKMAYSPDEPLREAMRIGEEATVVIADWFGNPIQRFMIKKFKDPFPVKSIEATLKGMREIVKKLEKKLTKEIGKGKKNLGRKKYRSAIGTFRSVLTYRGYEACALAEAAMEEAMKAGEKAVEEAAAQAEKSPKKAIAALKSLIQDFQDSRVEDAAWDALEALEEEEES